MSEYLTRAYEAELAILKQQQQMLYQVVEEKRPQDRFLGERIASTLRNLDAIKNLQIVLGF